MALQELGIKFFWKGFGLNEKCYDNSGKVLIECDPAYFRPLEVDTLLGNAAKARKELNWKPKTNLKSLVKEMVAKELNILDDSKK
jgi:GDPmannose 4,6-dehydratase